MHNFHISGNTIVLQTRPENSDHFTLNLIELRITLILIERYINSKLIAFDIKLVKSTTLSGLLSEFYLLQCSLHTTKKKHKCVCIFIRLRSVP